MSANCNENKKPVVELRIFGEGADDVMAQVRVLAGNNGPANSPAITSASTDELLHELRQRFASQVPPFVVRVLPFDGGEQQGEQTAAAQAGDAAPKRPRGRPPKATTAPEPAPTPATTEEQREEPKPLAPGALVPAATATQATVEAIKADAIAGAAEEAPAALTTDDMRAALNAYATQHGPAKARVLMQEHGGALKLADIPADKYAALHGALVAGVASEQAAAA